MKKFFGNRWTKRALLFSLVVSMMVCTAFAAEGDTAASSSSTIITAFETGFQQVKTDAFAILAVAVPVAVSIAAVIFISRKAMGWFKSMAK